MPEEIKHKNINARHEDKDREELDRMTVLQEAPDADLSAREYQAEEAIAPQQGDIVFNPLIGAKNQEVVAGASVVEEQDFQNRQDRDIEQDELDEITQINDQSLQADNPVQERGATSQPSAPRTTSNETASGFVQNDEVLEGNVQADAVDRVGTANITPDVTIVNDVDDDANSEVSSIEAGPAQSEQNINNETDIADEDITVDDINDDVVEDITDSGTDDTVDDSVDSGGDDNSPVDSVDNGNNGKGPGNNKGHGNNDDGVDDDNPGQGMGGPNADKEGDGIDEDEHTPPGQQDNEFDEIETSASDDQSWDELVMGGADNVDDGSTGESNWLETIDNDQGEDNKNGNGKGKGKGNSKGGDHENDLSGGDDVPVDIGDVSEGGHVDVSGVGVM